MSHLLMAPDRICSYLFDCYSGIITLSEVIMSNELALANAIASVEMEGLHLSDEGYELCRQYSDNELTWAEFLVKALEIANNPE